MILSLRSRCMYNPSFLLTSCVAVAPIVLFLLLAGVGLHVCCRGPRVEAMPRTPQQIPCQEGPQSVPDAGSSQTHALLRHTFQAPPGQLSRLRGRHALLYVPRPRAGIKVPPEWEFLRKQGAGRHRLLAVCSITIADVASETLCPVLLNNSRCAAPLLLKVVCLLFDCISYIPAPATY